MTISYPLAWPLDSRRRPIRPVQIDLRVAAASRSGGQSYTGVEQVVASPAARWEGKLVFPRMDRVTLLTWRGFVAAMQGRVGSVLMPAFEYGKQPWPNDAFGRRLTPAIARNPSLRGTPAEIDPTSDPKIIVTAAAAAALNATSITMAVPLAGPILPGHRFSFAGALYEIMQTATNADKTVTADVHPWLRAPIAAGAALEFANPVVAVRFKTDDEGKLDLEVGRIANPEINVVEAF